MSKEARSTRPGLKRPARPLKAPQYVATRRPQTPLPAPDPPRRSTAAWTMGGIFLGGVTAYATIVYLSYSRDVSGSDDLNVPLDVSDRYNKTASSYDADVDLMEKTMWLGYLRRKLIKQAQGHVLEVSVGTGRNMQYYKPKEQCKTLTFVDQSSPMIEVAKRKFKELYPVYAKAVFRVQDAAEPIKGPTGEGFDTIVQTMGLCSTPDPEGLLKNLGRMANQERGKILLLEHGVSKYAWLNRILDKSAPAHADRHGCWWNKDIGGIVERSGLQVVTLKRYHFGTTWWIELEPQKDVKPDQKEKGQG